MTIAAWDELFGPSYTLFSTKAECQRAVNTYRQFIETGAGSGKFVTYKTLGTTPIFQPSGGRGQFRGNGIELNGAVTLVIDNKAYLLSSKDTVATAYATALVNDFATVRFAASGTSVMFVSGGKLYRAAAGVVTDTGVGFTPVDIVYISTYYVALSNTNQFFWSTDDGVTWNPANVQTAEANANNFVGALVQNNILFLYGNRVTQPFGVGSNANAPFVAQTSGVIPMGCEAIGSLQSLGKYRYWIGQNKEGTAVVYRAYGYEYQRISNFALERKMHEYERDFGISDAIAMPYQHEGQEFYRLTFPAANATWELNATITETTGVPEWSELASRQLGVSAYSRNRSNMIISAFGILLSGDYSNGWLSELTPDNYTETGFPIPYLRRAPHLTKGGIRSTYSRLEMLMETGVGVDPPLWLNNYGMNRATFVIALAAAVAAGTVTAAQALVLQNIYDMLPYTPLNPYPDPDTMHTTLGFDPWGGYATLTGGTVIGSPPQIGLQYSNNGGVTFGPVLNRSLGMPGDTPTIHWDAMGASQDRVFQLSGDGPNKLAMVTAYLDSEPMFS